MNPFEFLVNHIGNLFLKWGDGKALYIGRDMDNAEVAFFGGIGTSAGVKEIYIDGAGANTANPTVDSPVVRLRGFACPNPSQELTMFSFKEKLTVLSPTRCKLELSIGKSGQEIPFYTVIYENGETIVQG